jgi:NADPH2 dehydrogenase
MTAKRAVQAGVDTIEIHGAHGYLIHQFQSPAINNRSDEYGKDLSKFGVEVIQAIKEVIPSDMPLIMRISAVEHIDGGYGMEHSLELCRKYKQAGVDLFHVSSGGEGPVRPNIFPGYQVPFATIVKNNLNVPVIAVGKLEDPKLAQETISNLDADLIAVGKGMLKNPYWAIYAMETVEGLGEKNAPKQYQIAF